MEFMLHRTSASHQKPPRHLYRSGSGWSRSRAANRNSAVYSDYFSDPIWNQATEVSLPKPGDVQHHGAIREEEDGGWTDVELAPSVHGGKDAWLPDIAHVGLRIRGLRVFLKSQASSSSALSSAFSRRTAEEKKKAERPVERNLIQDVNQDIPPGSLTAIIGASGSGKSTLLNTIAERFSSQVHVEGSVTFHRHAGSGTTRSAYVRQDDVLMPGLTVRETLVYASRLRHPAGTSEEHARRVDETMAMLSLGRCGHTQTGQCSGGERRRTSIGIALLANPSVVLLDEPTTGLDAASALSVMRALQDLAVRGRTIIATLHSPREAIFSLFDHLVVMCQGTLVYGGPADACLSHFARLGHEAPPHSNPAAFVIDLAALDYQSPEHAEASRARTALLKSAWKEESLIMRAGDATPEPADGAWKEAPGCAHGAWRDAAVSSLEKTITLLRRNLLLIGREKRSVLASIAGAAALGLVAGLINWRLGRDETAIRAREGALYTAMTLLTNVYASMELFSLTRDVRIFDHERGDGVVASWEFVLARRLSHFLVQDVPVPLVFSLVFYYLANLRQTSLAYWYFLLFVFLAHYASRCWATVAIALHRNYASASMVTGLWITLQTFCAGFLIQVDRLPVYLRWLRWLTPASYIFSGMASNEFTGQFFDCPFPGGTANPVCDPYTGRYILSSLGFGESWTLIPLAATAGFIGFYVFLAIMILHWRDTSIQSADGGTAKKEGKKEDTKKNLQETQPLDDMVEVPDTEIEPVNVNVHDLSVYPRGSQPKPILESLTINIPSRSLTAIIGPSGSGKTTLLNAIVGRDGERYRTLGSVRLNSRPLSARAHWCAYVPQHDQGLVATLSVRETLRYAARLRLPSSVPLHEKEARADAVLARLGLADCAGVRIGDETTKGISGGQRRRVSVGIQLLSEPRVLVLDEPTSGLDHFTARAVLDLLQGLARHEGRTVVATVHQLGARDLAELFDHVVLMARGGRLVFSGPPALMLPYLERLGHFCDGNTSAADFASDLLNGGDEELIDGLVQAWAEWVRTTSRPKRTSHADSLASDASSSISSLSSSLSSSKNASKSGKTARFWPTFTTLLQRSSLHYRRDPSALKARLVQPVSYALMLTLFFAPLQRQDSGPVAAAIQTYAGYVQLLAALCSVGLVQNTAIYPAERALFRFEHADRASSAPAFFLHYLALELPAEIAAALAFAVLAVFAVGLPRTAIMFGAVAYNGFLLLNCGESFGIIFFTIFSRSDFALTMVSMVLSITLLMSGVVTPGLSPVLKAINNLSPTYHAVSNLLPFALRDLVFDCASGDGCIVETGRDALASLGFDDTTSWGLWGLACCAVGFRLLAGVVLQLNSWGARRRVVERWERWRGEAAKPEVGKGKGEDGNEMV